MEWSRPQRLELVHLLGEGWAGSVYAAADLDGSGLVAVRLVTVAPGPLAATMTLGAGQRHPHILPLSLPEERQAHVLSVMPLAGAGSLRRLLPPGGKGLAPEQLLDLLRQVAEALVFAHAQGAVHGNLKPENVLLEPRGEDLWVWLADFGLNGLRPTDPHSPYQSAEQRAGGAATEHDDLYALGALLFEGLSGSPLPLNPAPDDLLVLGDPWRKLAARCLGLSVPFPDLAGFLGQVRALHLAAGVQGATGGAQLLSLSADLPAAGTGPAPDAGADVTALRPGETRTLTLTLRGAPELDGEAVRLEVEGLPAGWAAPLPPVTLRAGTEALVSLGLTAPRLPDTAPRRLDVTVLALGTRPDPVPDPAAPNPPAGRRVLARLPLALRVLPFVDSVLDLRPAQPAVRRSATVALSLRNRGNRAQQYNLDLTVPPGAVVDHGAVRRQFELAPGGEYHDTLQLRLPATLLRGRTLHVLGVAHQLSRPGDAAPGQPSPWPPVHSAVQASARLDQRPLLPWWAAGLLAGAALAGAAWAARPPSIGEFALVGGVPARGEAFTLTWRTSGAGSVRIEELPGRTLGGSGQTQVPGLQTPRTYTLVASGPLARQTRQLTVSPRVPAPRVTALSVTPAQAALGQTVTVRWATENAAAVRLTPFGTVPATGSRQLTLRRDTRFELSARGGGDLAGQQDRSVQVATLRPPQIARFSITPATVTPGQPVTVRWQVGGASRVRLAPLGDLPASGNRTFVPPASANYTLKASNGQTEVMAAAAVTVVARPARILAFTVSPASPVIGQPLTVRWQTGGARSAELRWSDQRQTLPPSGDLSLIATAQMGRLTLVAQGESGPPVLRTRALTLRAPQAAAPSPRPAPTSPPPSVRVPAPQVPAAPATVPRAPAVQAPAPPAPAAQPPAAQSPGNPSPAVQSPVVQPPASRPPAARPPAAQTPAAVPRITSFTASAARPTVGQILTLRWQGRGSGRVVLSGPDGRALGTFAPSAQTRVRVTQPGTQTFTLSRATGTGRLARLSVTVARAAASTPPAVQSRPSRTPPATSGTGASGSGASVPVTPAVPRIEKFVAFPASLRPGEFATLVWKVRGASKVFIVGLRGPNADGSFAPAGQTATPRARTADQSFVLSAGGRRVTLRVPLRAVAAPSAAAQPYAGVAGTWRHSFGGLALRVEGTRVTGTLTSIRPDLPGGSVRGTLGGPPGAPTLNAFVRADGTDTAMVVQFDLAAQTFSGTYAGRGAQVRWTGARPDPAWELP
ncbi:serine/threonine-protein kinase [Deinococcus petrolearius]|uniref:Serine/threonine-protein kinase n=1 Tax=Deinococcus petrolearius TaxID=1751295 RepID=A0ABW1DRR0_9DEIO